MFNWNVSEASLSFVTYGVVHAFTPYTTIPFRGAKIQQGTNLELVLCHLDWLHKISQEQEDMSCKSFASFVITSISYIAT